MSYIKPTTTNIITPTMITKIPIAEIKRNICFVKVEPEFVSEFSSDFTLTDFWSLRSSIREAGFKSQHVHLVEPWSASPVTRRLAVVIKPNRVHFRYGLYGSFHCSPPCLAATQLFQVLNHIYGLIGMGISPIRFAPLGSARVHTLVCFKQTEEIFHSRKSPLN